MTESLVRVFEKLINTIDIIWSICFLCLSLALLIWGFFFCHMGVLDKSFLASGTAFCPRYLCVCYSNTEKMKHDTGVEGLKKNRKLSITMEKFGTASVLTPVLARCFLISVRKCGFSKESRPICESFVTLLMRSGDRCLARHHSWLGRPETPPPEAVMLVIMWITLCPVSSLCKHRNYV